jgi:hypothetical protein
LTDLQSKRVRAKNGDTISARENGRLQAKHAGTLIKPAAAE